MCPNLAQIWGLCLNLVKRTQPVSPKNVYLLKGWVPSDLACGCPSLAPAPPHREHWVLVPQTDQSPDEWLARGGKPASQKLNAGTPIPHTASLCLAGLPEGRGRKVKPPSADGACEVQTDPA